MEQLKQIVSNDLEKAEKIIFNVISGDNYIKNKICDFLNSPTKRIRALLSLLYIKAQNINITEDIINIIAAGELIHNASLLHDDIVDNAEFRRNKTTFAREISPKMSVIAGDLLVAEAVNLILNTNNSEIIKYFINCTKRMSEAEILQFANRGTTPVFDTYINICEGKTSALFSAILKSLAILCNLNLENAEDFAVNFGLVFQIRNDLEPASAQNDILNGVITIKNVLGIEKTNTLIDNYKIKMRSIIKDFPENIYTQGLNDLINKL